MFSQPENTKKNCLQVTAGQAESSSDPLHADDQETRASLTVIYICEFANTNVFKKCLK